METGDLLLFRWDSILSFLYNLFGSTYSHAGILIKNPKTFNLDLPDGDYILHTTFIGNTYDIHIEPLEDVIAYYGRAEARVIHASRNKYFYIMLEELIRRFKTRSTGISMFDWLCQVSYSKPFLSSEWYRTSQQFWCSSLVSYVYQEVGWIHCIDWSTVSPTGLSKNCLTRRFPIDNPKYV